MAYPKIKLSDDSGNAVGVTDNRLNVNAYLSATPTIDIGDVSIKSGDGTAITDTVSGRLDVTLDSNSGVHAEDSEHTSADKGIMPLAVRNDTLAALAGTDGDYAPLQVNADGALYIDVADGGVLDTGIDQIVTYQLTQITQLGVLATISNLLTTIDVDTGNIFNTVNAPLHLSGDVHSDQNGLGMLGIRNDELAALTLVADGDYSFFQVNALGALYTTGGEVENAAVQSEPTLIGGRFDSSARTLGNGDAGAVALNASGHVIMDVVDGGQLDTIIDTLETTLTAIETDQAAIEVLLTGIDSDTDAIKTAVQILDNAIDGNEMQVDIVSSATLTVNSHAVTNAGTFAVQAGHDITGMVSDRDLDIGTSAEKIHTAADIAIKRIDIQASPNNTGYIFVGDSGVAGNGSGGGIRLGAGDFYSLDIDNTGAVYVSASVADEDVYYTYFT